MDRSRCFALFLVVLTVGWLGLTCAAALHHCPDREPGSHEHSCEFYGHGVQASALAEPHVSLRGFACAVPPCVSAVGEAAALRASPFDRTCTCERAPPA
jgi:hypothetical protein